MHCRTCSIIQRPTHCDTVNLPCNITYHNETKPWKELTQSIGNNKSEEMELYRLLPMTPAAMLLKVAYASEYKDCYASRERFK